MSYLLWDRLSPAPVRQPYHLAGPPGADRRSRSGSGWRLAGLHGGSRQPPDGRTATAKGQKRTSREAKKPKADKKKLSPPSGIVASALGKPKVAVGAHAMVDGRRRAEPAGHAAVRGRPTREIDDVEPPASGSAGQP